MSDNLESLSDAQLSEIVAVEVAGWTKGDVRYGFMPWIEPGKNAYQSGGRMSCPSYATDVNAVLPLMDQCSCWDAGFSQDTGYYVSTPFHSAEAKTIARAACLALVRAKRSQS